MPVSNWNGDGAPFVKDGFKYYLAVAVPLTFLLLTLWALAMLLLWMAWLLEFRPRSAQPEPGVGLSRIDA
jgi:hypothetical protein